MLEKIANYNQEEIIAHIEKLKFFESSVNTNDFAALFVAKAPKSGSTFLADVLQKAFNCSMHIYAEVATSPLGRADALDSNISYNRLLELKSRYKKIIGQEHTLMTPHNLLMAKKFKIKPIVTTRNLFDTTISFVELLERLLPNSDTVPSDLKSGDSRIDFQSNYFVTFPAYYWKKFNSLEMAKKIDVTIDYLLPWYFVFYSSWYWAEEQGLKVFWTDFSEHTQDLNNTISKIATFFDIEHHLNKEKLALLHNKNKDGDIKINYNIGKANRGNILSKRQKNRIINIGKMYLPLKSFEHLI